MSIWASWEYIGALDEPKPRGCVVAYREGFSNHYPTKEDGLASLGVAHIPPYCVPGAGDDSDWPEVGPWLRLTINSPEAQSWWGVDGAKPGEPAPYPIHGSVVLDEAAVRALYRDLKKWLKAPKVRPEETK